MFPLTPDVRATVRAKPAKIEWRLAAEHPQAGTPPPSVDPCHLRGRPLVWVSLEPSEANAGVAELSCEMWPEHRRVRLARQDR